MRSSFIRILIIIFAISALDAEPYDQLANELLLKIKDKDLKKVFSVIPFQAKGAKSGIDDEATESIIHALKRSNINIAARSDFTDLLKEIELSQKGAGKKKMDLENIANASIAVMGIVHYFENGSKKIFVKTIDLNNFLILSVAEITVGNIEDKSLLKEVVTGYEKIFYDSFFDKIHFSMFLGSGWQTGIAAPVDTLNTVYLTGAPSIFWIRLGYPVNNQLLLFFQMGSFYLINPFISATNNILKENQLNKVDIAQLDAGAGLAWFFLPSRFFLTASLGDASAIYKKTNESIDINYGFGLNVTFGYLQKLSRSFGIGYLLGIYYSHLEFSDISITIPTTRGYVNDYAFNIDTFIIYAGVSASFN
jgi:hypothetical protein